MVIYTNQFSESNYLLSKNKKILKDGRGRTSIKDLCGSGEKKKGLSKLTKITKFWIIVPVSVIMHENFCRQNIFQDLQNHIIVMSNS
jgi:hypothetical protein